MALNAKNLPQPVIFLFLHPFFCITLTHNGDVLRTCLLFCVPCEGDKRVVVVVVVVVSSIVCRVRELDC